MAVGHDPSMEELRAMVLSKINEPKSTGFDDPREWSDQDLKEFLKSVSFRDLSRLFAKLTRRRKTWLMATPLEWSYWPWSSRSYMSRKSRHLGNH
jgi:hypothetical protein